MSPFVCFLSVLTNTQFIDSMLVLKPDSAHLFRGLLQDQEQQSTVFFTEPS